MKLSHRRNYAARARIARALAHEARLMLLDALQQQGELCVSEMTELAGLDQSTVSKHLAILKETGLVGVRRQGPSSYYSVTCACLDGFFGCMESVLTANLNAQRELVSL